MLQTSFKDRYAIKGRHQKVRELKSPLLLNY